MTSVVKREILAERSASAYMGVLSVQVVFTGYQILAKVSLTGRGIDPVGFALVRVLGTAVFSFLASVVTLPASQVLLRWEHRWQFLLLGFFMTCNVVGLILALEHTGSAVVAILQVLRPIFAALLSRLMGIERFTYHNFIGMGICMAGTIVVTMAGSPLTAGSVGDSPFFGFLFVCLHSLGQSAYVLLQPSLLDCGYSPLVINAHAFLVASVLIAALLPLSFHSGKWYEPTLFYYLTVAYSIFLVGSYTYAVMGWAAKRIGGTAVMLFMLIQAILTVVAGRIFLAESMYSFQAVGGVLIIGGIIVFLSGQQQHDGKEHVPISKV